MSNSINLTIEFGGGIELLTAPPQPKRHTIQLPSRVAPTFNNGNGVTPAVTAPSGTTSTAETAGTERPTMSYLIQWILNNLVVERPDLFADPSAPTTVRPGILVLINDADWELEGESAYELEDGDHISFIRDFYLWIQRDGSPQGRCRIVNDEWNEDDSKFAYVGHRPGTKWLLRTI